MDQKKLGRKRTVRFRMYFDGKGAAAAAVMMGAAFFLRVVYYFGFPNLSGCGAFALVFDLILPLLLCAAFAVMLKGFRCNQPWLYGILSMLYCVLMIVWTFRLGHTLHSVLALVWYLIAIAVLVGMLEGYIGNRVILQLVFLISVFCRLIFFDLEEYIFSLRLVDFLPEASALCGLIALSSFARCLIPERLRHRAGKEI